MKKIFSVILSFVFLGAMLIYFNLRTAKDVFLQSPVSEWYASYFRNEKLFDADHVISSLDNGMKIVLNRHDRCVCYLTRVTGRWDSNETAAINSIVRPGFTVVEVGANFGVHTLRMADLVGSKGAVHTFEANPNVSKYLKQSIALNDLQTRVNVYEKAAGDRAEDVYLTYGVANIGGGHLVSNEEGTIPVKMVTLDDELGSPKIDLLKIDAEGCEAKIIDGAKDIIAASPDMILMMEWCPGHLKNQGSNPKEFLEKLKNLGFKAWRIGKHKNHQANLIKVTYGEILNTEYCDLVFSRSNNVL